MFFATSVAFLLNTPTLIGPDEVAQFDRVYAASHGQVVLAPAEINISTGVRGVANTYVMSLMKANAASWAEFTPITRGHRPSLAELGGNQRSLEVDVSNYITQHPPLYYGLMGGLVWLIPGSDDMPADTLVLITRLFDVLMLLPIPLLFWYSARQMLGDSPVTTAAAFLPLIVPGLARGAATVNNDNLAILLGAAMVALCIKVMRGDRTVGTAALLAGLAVAGSLTKATIMFVLIMIPLAYLLQARRHRRIPKPVVLITLTVGALGAGAWWMRNLVLFGEVQPNAWGTAFAAAQGAVRTADLPVDNAFYFEHIVTKVPSRFFGALGLLEPPQLPEPMTWILSTLVVASFAVAVVTLRGRRAEVVITAAVPAAATVMMCFQAYRHYLDYLSIPGVQGRYLYPAMFGVIFPIAVAVGLVLGRARAWAPLVVAVGGLVVSGWAVYTSVEYTWLHRGEQLDPTTWWRAFKTLTSFFPLPEAASAAIAIMVGLLLIAGLVMVTLTCRHDAQAGVSSPTPDAAAPSLAYT